MKKLLLFGWLLLTGFTLPAQVSVEGRVDTNDMLIGDHLHYTLTISAEPGVDIKQIEFDKLTNAEGFELIRMGGLDTMSRTPQFLLTQQLTLTSFDSGAYYLPEVSVTFDFQGREGSVQTNRIPVQVRTLPTAEGGDLQPIKPIIREPLNLWDVLPYILGVFGLIVVGLFLRWYFVDRKRPKQTTSPPPPPRPAHEVALEKLEKLEKSGLLEQEEYKAFQSELTYVLREYLEGRFGIRAIETTTGEIIAQMDAVDTERDWRDELRAMLQTADLVKFAKATPPPSFHQQALSTVRSFVQATIPAPEPVEKEAIDQAPKSDNP